MICSELGEPFWLKLADGLAGYGNRGWLQVPQHVFIYKPVRNDGRWENCKENSLQSAAWNTSVSVCVGKGRVSWNRWFRYVSSKALKTETERFIELNRELESRVVRSELNKDLTCEYEITIPEDIMTQYIAPRGMENVIDTRKNE